MEDTDIDHFSINACTNCRRLHKKCDKRLPICLLCAKHKKTCNYDNVGKRGPKTAAEYSQPYPQIKVHKVVDKRPIDSSSKSESNINLYKPSLVRLPTVIPPSRARIAAQYVEDEVFGRPLGVKPADEDLALIHAVHAFTFQHNQEQAKMHYNKAYSLITSKFDRIYNNEILQTTYLFLGMHCVLSDDIDRATFFLETIKSVLDKNANNLSPGQKYLSHIYSMIMQLTQGEISIERMIKTIIIQHVTSVENLQNDDPMAILMRENFTDLVAPRDAEQIRMDLALRTNEYELNEERISRISGTLMGIMDKLKGILPSSIIDMQKFSASMMFQGAHLQRYMELNEYEKAKPIADSIARISSLPYYEKTYIMASVVVHLAARAHLQLIQYTRDYNERSELIDYLCMEHNALSFVIMKNKILGERLIPMVESIRQMLNRVQENVTLTSTFFMHTPQPEPTLINFGQNFAPYPDFSENSEMVSIETLNEEVAVFDALDKFFNEFATDDVLL
jgi:hypothetical protein